MKKVGRRLGLLFNAWCFSDGRQAFGSFLSFLESGVFFFFALPLLERSLVVRRTFEKVDISFEGEEV